MNTESANMAGSDKKEQQLRSKESVSGGAQPLIVQDPDVSHFVLPGTPIGLIPRVKLNTDLTTTITTWPQLPDPGDTEHYRLQIARAGSSEWAILDEHSYTGGDTWVPLDFTISSTFLLDPTHEGPFDLRYEHENFVGIKDWSNRVRIQIDKVPPNGAAPPQKMIFTIKPPITDPTFGANDFLEATIPLWEGGELIDVKVAYAWLKGERARFPVYYTVTPPGDKSILFNLRLTPLPRTQYPNTQCTQAMGTQTLSLQRVPTAGADLTVDAWPFMEVGQLLTIEATGINNGGATTPITVRSKVAVTAEEFAKKKIEEKLPRVYLQTLKLNEQFTLKARVSFDGGETETLFNDTYLTLTS
jgi:hypothetical protein